MASPSLTRREAMAGAALLAAAALAPAARGSGPAAVRRDALHRGGSFAHGVASGDPGQRRITLWTRLDGVERAGALGWEVAADPDFRRVVANGRARSAPVRDFTTHVQLSSRRLRPGTPYWYRFHTRGANSPVGRFRTLRPPDSRESTRVGVYSCQDYEAGHYAAHRALADEDLDLVVCVGDYIYERALDDGRARRDRTGVNGDGDVQTLPEYRQKQRLYRSDPQLQAMHAAHPHLAFWDSHDIETVDGPSPDVDQYGSRRRVPREERLRAGILSFLEYQPQRHPAERTPVYRSLRIGANAELMLTDETLYHDPYPCAFAFPPPPCPAAEAPGRSLLGAAQKSWLKDRLRRSRAAWKLYLGGTMMMGFELTRGRPFNAGQWDGFQAERRELMEFLLAEDVRDVVRLSGDIHTFFAGQLTTSGRSDSPAAAVEFIGGAVSSAGIADGFAEQTGGDPALFAPIVEQAPLLNRHLTFMDSAHRGYKVVEARETGLTVTFRAVRESLQPDSEVFDLARFHVTRGESRVDRE